MDNKKYSRAVIFSGGVIEDYNFYKNIIKSDDYIICADGGISHLVKLNLKPDIFIGDFDSCNEKKVLSLDIMKNVKIERYISEKDQTDTHLCVLKAFEIGIRDILILGALGNRVDHSMANIMLLKFILENGGYGKILNEKNEVYLINCDISIKRKENHKISLIPITDTVSGISTFGLKYSLSDYTMKMGDSIGISNEFTQNECEVKIGCGIMMVVIAQD